MPIKDLDERLKTLEPNQIDQLPVEDGDSSESDDKGNPAFWNKSINFRTLPENVQNAILKSKERAKHSEFYYRLKSLQERIKVF